MKITILLGSARKGRQSHKVANYLNNELVKRGFNTDLIDLAEDPLPVLEDKAGQNPHEIEQIRKISKRLSVADALIFVTPEYHGSFSGVLKNALDYFWSEFQKKPIGVATVSTGKMGGINASTQLQHVILSLGAYPLPLKLLVPEVHTTFDNDFTISSDQLASTAGRFLDEFTWFTEAIVEKKERIQNLKSA
jgi:azobenzene reductase